MLFSFSSFHRKIITYCSVLCTLIISVQTADAQRKNIYTGPYFNKQKESGIATFEYIRGSGDRPVPNGSFEFKIDSLIADKNEVVKKKYNGAYEKGLKTGSWSYDLGRFDIAIRSIDYHEVSAGLQGSRKMIKARYSEGFPQGAWSFQEDAYHKDGSRQAVRKSNALFLDGVLIGDFTFADEAQGFALKGNIDAKGNLDKTWVLNYIQDSIPVQETRVYRQGFLISLEKVSKIGGAVIESIRYEGINEKLDALANKEAELDYKISVQGFGILFNDGYPEGSPELTSQYSGNAVMEFAMNYICNDSTTIHSLPGVKQAQKATTRRFRYFYSEREKNALAALQKQLTSMQARLKEIKGDVNLQANFNKTDSLAFAHAFFQKAAQRRHVMDSLSSLLGRPEFEYINRANYFQNEASFLAFNDTIFYQFDGQVRWRVETIAAEGVDFKFIEKLALYSRNLSQRVDTLYIAITPELDQLRKQNLTQLMDVKIAQLIDTVNRVYGRKEYYASSNQATRVNTNPLQEHVYQHFAVNQFNVLSQLYSNAHDYQTRLDLGDSIIFTLQKVIDVYSPLDSILKRRDVVDEAYITYSFDPFTYNYNFRNREKRRLYSRLAEDLYGYLINELTAEQNIAQLPDRIARIDQLFDIMMDLRHRNTRSLERRLARTNRPDRIMRLIGMKE
jgi:hypothetical protein